MGGAFGSTFPLTVVLTAELWGVRLRYLEIDRQFGTNRSQSSTAQPLYTVRFPGRFGHVLF